MVDLAIVIAEIDGVLAEHAALRKRSQHDDCSDLPDSEVVMVATMLSACIDRLAPSGISYKKDATALAKNSYRLPGLVGILRAMRKDYEAGRLRRFEEVVHAAIFDDFLSEAERLVAEGRLLPAAIIAGVTLEEHLRKLGDKHLPGGNAKKAATVNDDLVKAGVYGKPEQSQTLSWLQLRNEAAHGDPAFLKRTAPEIALMIAGIRSFLVRLPA